MSSLTDISTHLNEIRQQMKRYRRTSIRYGKVSSIVGTIIQCTGLHASVGEVYGIETIMDTVVPAEVVGLKEGQALLMPYDRIKGMRAGCRVEYLGQSLTINVGNEMLGRVIDANGDPIDQEGPLLCSNQQHVHNDPPSPVERQPINEIMYTGVRAIDALNTIGKGQRIGLFAGSGVGKSVLLGMIARHSDADVNVIALIGERGREVQEFLDDILDDELMSRSVVVAETSDKSAMSRIKAAYTATAVAEYFRDRGKNVLLMMDSVTRVAMAQREVGLATGEPPTTKGYTPSVFSMLPKFLERVGKTTKGSITGIYTVLVDNDDMNEPIADAVRSILDGHIVLSRRLAHKNHYPAIDVPGSISRVMPNVVTPEQRNLAGEVRDLIATYREAENLINIGAYVEGSNPKIDKAVEKRPDLESFLIQDIHEVDFRENLWKSLEQIVK
ncbi:type III secretion system ATPase, FliI/YscN [Fodinibius roseus]|uniref:Type III secretion system ATPase, FliI/YscN n=1 Tax=Fodinibius roseus TaxID=1194090 RepID=A0A1M5HGK6_9BACT|nr:FliI/YscN family ATPase [Fodinibius roseus]SHG14962.1 type III secretion system ATPase, FliI/YscN [Fodinibius roseus]